MSTVLPRSSVSLRASLGEVWRFRELFRSLVARNLKVKYGRSVLGFVWTLLNPLLAVSILVVVFSRIIRIQVPDYWAFMLSSYFVWNFTVQTLSTGTYVLAEHTALRRSAAFPSEVLVFGATAARLVEFAVEMVLVLVILIVFHHHGVPASFALLPVLVVIQVLIAIGLVLPIATLSIFYHDVQHALPIVLMMLFYLSPVFYPTDLVPESLQQVYFLNPIAGLLTLFHRVLYQGRLPSAALLLAMMTTALGLYVIGYAIFNRYKRIFAEL